MNLIGGFEAKIFEHLQNLEVIWYIESIQFHVEKLKLSRDIRG